MIGLLSAIGRAVVVTAAALTVIGFSVGGYLTARTRRPSCMAAALRYRGEAGLHPSSYSAW